MHTKNKFTANHSWLIVFFTLIGMSYATENEGTAEMRPGQLSSARPKTPSAHIDKHPAVREMHIGADAARAKGLAQANSAKQILEASKALRMRAADSMKKH